MNCPFCHTAIGDVVFARSENFLAIYNIAPILPGHTLIIPRKHYESAMELDDKKLSEMIVFSRKVTKLLLRVFDAEAFNWSVQDKEIAGQTLTHLHMHIVLRYPGDLPEPGDWYPEIKQNYEKILDSESREKLTEGEMRGIVYRLREEVKRDF